jgi:hypothetical protein
VTSKIQETESEDDSDRDKHQANKSMDFIKSLMGE